MAQKKTGTLWKKLFDSWDKRKAKKAEKKAARAEKKPQKEKPRQVTEMEDKKKLRRRRSRRRALIRVVIVVVVCAALFLLWQNWDVLAPDRLFNRLQDWFGSGTGNYPVDVSGLTVHQIERSQDYTVMLTDSHLIYYNSSGAEVNRYACTYTSALMRTAGQYVLLAEQGGTRLQLNTRTSTLVEMTADQKILSVAVNEKGQFAVLTNGTQGYTVQVKVYDNKGDLLYTRSRNQIATEVALSADGEQLSLLSVQAQSGNLNTDIAVFRLDSADPAPMCSYTAKDTLLYRLGYLADGWLTAVGENGAVLLDTGDGLATLYVPGEMRVLGYAVGKEDFALLLRPYGSTGDGKVQIISKEGKVRREISFTGEARHLSYSEDGYVLLTDSYVQRLTASGNSKSVPISADGQQAVLDGETAIVLGLNELKAYSLKG